MRGKDVIGDTFGEILATQDSDLFWSGTYSTSYTKARGLSPLINKDFSQIALPQELQKFYDLLFPPNTSAFYKEFLLYCYLRLVASTDRAEDIKKYDSRITYELDSLQDYFKFSRITSVYSSDPGFRLYVYGEMKSYEEMLDSSNFFLIAQMGSSSAVTVKNVTQGLYYRPAGQASKEYKSNVIPITTAPSGKSSTKIAIGDLGLYFFIEGDMSQLTNTAGKLWTFNVEAPFILDTFAKVKELESRYAIVEDMLHYHQDECNLSYEHLWHMHYNTIHKLAGLLHAYVERVNIVWEMYQ